MRSLIICAFLFLLFEANAEQRALLIGVSNYPSDSGWQELSSYNDLIHIEEALKINGFGKAFISKIEDEQATYAGILKAFDQLEKSIKRGDVVYIHFSGHGQQILDNNKDEVDGLDEAIVPYDSPKYFSKNEYEGERLIRDDLLRELTTAIRKKLGASGQLVLVLDACNSGTGTRGKKKVLNRTRGTEIIMAPNSFDVSQSKKRKEQMMEINAIKNKRMLAAMASFYSTTAKELNYETFDSQLQPIGGLSYSIYSILSRTNDKLTFQELYDRIVLRMKILSPKQHPQWEGDRDIVLFGKEKRFDSQELFTISEELDEKRLVVDIGTINGVFEESRVEIFSIDKQKVVNAGVVTNSNLTNSLVECENIYQREHDELLKVRIVSKASSASDVVIRYDVPKNSEWDDLIEKLKAETFIEESNCNADLFFQTKSNNAIQLSNIEGVVMYESKKQDCFDELMNAILLFKQAKFLKRYEAPSTRYDFSIQLLRTNCSIPLTEIKNKNIINSNKLKVGDCIQVLIKNIGEKPAYFTLIDIQPDYQLNMVIPNEYNGKTASDYYLKPNETYITDFVIDVGEPIGEEVLKLICTPKPLNLATLLSQKYRNTRGLSNPNALENILGFENHNISNENISEKSSRIDEVGVTTLFFEILP